MRRRSTLAVAMTISAAVVSLGVVTPSAVAVTSPGQASAIAPVIDQSFTSTDDVNNLINEGARFVAQTFTAGRTGLLAGVSVDVFDCCSSPYTLSIALRTVGPDGTPTNLVLGEARAASCCPPLSQIVTFAQPIRVVAGTQYAIVASYPDAPFAGSGRGQGAWLGSSTDGYPGGRSLSYYSIPPVGPGWIEGGGLGSTDLNFRTYVEAVPPVPTTKSSCMRSGWESVATESGEPFRNQGQCISDVEHRKKR